MDSEDDYVGAVFRLGRSGDKLKKGKKLKLPHRVNIYGFAPFTDYEGELHYAYLSEKDYLKVIDDKKEILWESPDYYGGSAIRIEREEALTDTGYGDSADVSFIRPRIVVNAAGDLLVTRNKGPRTFSRYRSFKSSDLVTLNWNGFALNEVDKTAEQSGYLVDFDIADIDGDGSDEKVTLVQFKQGGFIGSTRSAIVAYDVK